MARLPAIIRLTEEEKTILFDWCRQESAESQSAVRAQIILLSNEQLTVEEIARQLHTRPARVSKWRQRFAKHRLFGLSDFQRSGGPGRYDENTEKRVLNLVKQPPPEGYQQWNGRLLAESLGNVSQAQVWRILRRHEVQLTRRHSWSISTDLEFAPKVADIVGLYLYPPESALVLSVEGMMHAPQLDAKGYLRLTNGKAVKDFMRGERQESTITLSEALTAMAAQLQAGHAQFRCRRRFLDFMNEILAARSEQTIHVLLNYLSAKNPKWDRWLLKHPQVRLHFIPTYTSWLNQVECWFSVFGGIALSGKSSDQPRELRDAINGFVAAHQRDTMPFEWTKMLSPAPILGETYVEAPH
jgi:transposase